MGLLAAESEAAVTSFVNLHSELNEGRWEPLDDRDTNQNVVGNQASDGGKALTELMTNMVDAFLMKKAAERGIDPKSAEAPQTMYEAVDRLVHNMHGGKLTNLPSNDRFFKEFAPENLLIGITGALRSTEGRPCYTFLDQGEGQTPERFPNTFLSLSAGTKKDIPFVQGKYNMGSSGVLGFCGKQSYKLIVSRKYDCDHPWAWTLIRKRPSAGAMPVYEGLRTANKNIHTFNAPEGIFPFKYKASGERYEDIRVDSGTIVKLYDYQIGKRLLARSFLGAQEAFIENLVETILPFRIYDFRQTPSATRKGHRAAGVDVRPFYGMEWKLLSDDAEDRSEADAEGKTTEIPAGKRLELDIIQDGELGKIVIHAITLPRELHDWLKHSNNRVFHVVNGQVQYKQTRAFLTECGFPALKDRVVLIIDATNLLPGAHFDVWKGDREHVKETVLGEQYRARVKASVKKSENLAEWNNQISREELRSATSKQSEELFQKLVSADKSLALLLSLQTPSIKIPSGNSGKKEDAAARVKFEGRYSPSYLRIEERAKQSISLPINKSRPIGARTDVEDGYLSRPANQGSLTVYPIEDAAKFSIRTQLSSGRLTTYFEPLEGAVSVGEAFDFRLELQDAAMHTPVSDTFSLKITEFEVPEQRPPQPPRPPKDPHSTAGEGSGTSVIGRGLPHYKLLTKDGEPVGAHPVEKWPSGYTELNGGEVRPLADGEVLFLINYGNTYHLTARMKAKGDIARDAVTNKYILGMLVLMLGYEFAMRNVPDELKLQLADFDDEIRKIAARGAASNVLTIAEVLPKIFQVDTPEDE